MTLIVRCVAIFVLGLLMGVAEVEARTLTVNSDSDTHDLAPGDGLCADQSGFCTLRAAVEEANTAAGDTIRFSSGLYTIRLTIGALVVTGSDITILSDSESVVVDGAINPEGTDLIDARGGGFRLAGLTLAHSRRNGIVMKAKGARIGAPGVVTSVVGNGAGDSLSAGISVQDVDSADIGIGNVWVGLGGNGTQVDPNQYGIRIANSSGIQVGQAGLGNLISGNLRDGIAVDVHSHDVSIAANIIGLDVTGRNAVPNRRDGVSIRGGSSRIVVGGLTPEARNVISENIRHGISLSGFGTRENIIASNLIGLDSSGYFDAGNLDAGISLTNGACRNLIGVDSAGNTPRLVVAGSHGNGIEIIGLHTDSNKIDWSFVGSEVRGDGDRPNGRDHGQGIEISGGAKYNTIGGYDAAPRNVIVGNYGPGLTISGFGTEHNSVVGNYVGVYRLGNSPFGNSAGVVVRDSARYNAVGDSVAGNLISGNRADLFPLGAGVVIFGHTTSSNLVQNNRIGTDVTGTRTLRNQSAGIIIGGGASHNLIGGDTTLGNQISGNGTLPVNSGVATGVQVYGNGTAFNEISGNSIGVAADNVSSLGNNGHGIGLYGGASHNIVGGDDLSKRNNIYFNKYYGVWIDGTETSDNSVRQNSLSANDSGGIYLNAGANGGVLSPSILGATVDSVWGTATPNAAVDIYRARTGKLGRVQGVAFIEQTLSGPDGTFRISTTGLTAGDSLTAVQTVTSHGSSAFSTLVVVEQSTETSGSSDDSVGETTLEQNQPNPFNSGTVIRYALGSGSATTIDIVNTTGQTVKSFRFGFQVAGGHTIFWDGANDKGRQVASGIYFYRLTSSGGSLTKKMLLLK